MKRTHRIPILVGVFAALIAIPAGVANATYSYYIDGNTSYSTNHGCGTNNDLDDDTASLASYLWNNGNGWTGNHWLDTNAWPQDFVEACASTPFGAGGLDSSFADSAFLSVFSGHMNSGQMFYAYPHTESGVAMCSVTVGTNSRLGSMAGAQSNMMIYYGCCSLAISGLVNNANVQWNTQAAGFLDDESDGVDDIKNFAAGTVYGSPNITQWTEDLEDRPWWFTGDNSPIVVSYGADQTTAQNVETYAALLHTQALYPRATGPSCQQGQPYFWYNYYYIDHHNVCG